jgi:hypothetical protein
MKIILICLFAVSSFTAFADSDDCKSKALNVAKAIDKVYVPKLSKGTKISIQSVGKTLNSRNWLVDFYIPNAGGATSYSIEMQKQSCEIINLNMISE